MDWNSLTVPPLELKNYHPDKWNMWLTQFKLHVLTTPFLTLREPEKVAVLLLKIGTEITPIFDTFEVDVENISFDELVKRFTTYFHPVKARNVFLNLKQKSGETFEQFAARLRVLSYPCGFGPFQESFLRDVFVNNMEGRYGNIRAKILDSYADPNFQEVVSLANELLLEECSMGSGLRANNLISPQSHVNAPSARQNSKVLREASQGHNRESNQGHNREANQGHNHEANQGHNREANQGHNREANQGHNRPRRSNESTSSVPTFALPPIKCGDSVDVTVLATRNGLVHVYPTCCEEKRCKFFDLLNSSLNKANTQVKVDPDKRYAVLFQREWCRVIVASVRDGRASVESLDYGWRETFNVSEFRMLPLDFVGVAPLALKVTFLSNTDMDFTAGQCVRLIFKDVNKDLWSVALGTDNSSKGGVNEHKRGHHGNRNNPDTDRQKPKKAVQNKEDLSSSSQEEQRIKTVNLKKNQQSSGNRTYSRPDIQNQDDTSTDCTDNSKNNEFGELRGSRNYGVDQHRRGQNLNNRNFSKIDGNGVKSYEAGVDYKADTCNNLNSDFRGNRNFEGGNHNKRDPNNGNRNSARIDGNGMKSSPTDVDRRENFASNGSDYRGNRKTNVTNDDKRYQIPRDRNQIRNNDQKKQSKEDCHGVNTAKKDDSGTKNCSRGEDTEVRNVPSPDITKLVLDDPPIEMNQFTRVVVVHPVDERAAYVYPESSKMEFEEMCEYIQTLYCKDSQRKVLNKPTQGMYCAAPFEGDFYRARIQEVEQSSAKVLFYDFGNEECVPCNHLLLLPKSLAGPSLSFPIKIPPSYSLRDIDPMDVIEVKPKSKEGGMWLVDVRNWNNNSPFSSVPVDGSGASSPRAQQAKEVAGSTRSNSSRQSVEKAVSGGSSASGRSAGAPLAPHLDNTSTRSNSSRQSVEKPVSGGTSASGRSAGAPLASPLDIAPMRSPKLPIPKNTFTEVRVVYTGAEGIFVIPGSELQLMAELCSAVEGAAVSASPCSTPIIQKIYAAPFDNGMYRAQVLSIDRNRSCCRVKFVDFGNECDTPTSDLLELPPDLTSHFFIFPIRLDPSCDVVLQEAMDISISPVTLEPDGSWLVQLEGEPLNADYQLPDPDEARDAFISFSKKC